jgi:hypothetical protein
MLYYCDALSENVLQLSTYRYVCGINGTNLLKNYPVNPLHFSASSGNAPHFSIHNDKCCPVLLVYTGAGNFLPFSWYPVVGIKLLLCITLQASCFGIHPQETPYSSLYACAGMPWSSSLLGQEKGTGFVHACPCLVVSLLTGAGEAVDLLWG